jgi:hypothetical protein
MYQHWWNLSPCRLHLAGQAEVQGGAQNDPVFDYSTMQWTRFCNIITYSKSQRLVLSLPECASVALFLLMCQFIQDGWQRKTAEQHIKTVLFFTETRSVVVRQTRFRAHFQIQWVPSFKTIHELYNQFNNDGSVLERKCWRSSICAFSREHWRCLNGTAKKSQ